MWSRLCQSELIYNVLAVASIIAGTLLTLALRGRWHVWPLCAIAYRHRDFRVCAAWVAVWDAALEWRDGPGHCEQMLRRWG